MITGRVWFMSLNFKHDCKPSVWVHIILFFLHDWFWLTYIRCSHFSLSSPRASYPHTCHSVLCLHSFYFILYSVFVMIVHPPPTARSWLRAFRVFFFFWKLWRRPIGTLRSQPPSPFICLSYIFRAINYDVFLFISMLAGPKAYYIIYLLRFA